MKKLFCLVLCSLCLIGCSKDCGVDEGAVRRPKEELTVVYSWDSEPMQNVFDEVNSIINNGDCGKSLDVVGYPAIEDIISSPEYYSEMWTEDTAGCLHYEDGLVIVPCGDEFVVDILSDIPD